MNTVAFVTDAHLGQQLARSPRGMQTKICYNHVPGEHRQNLETILNDVAAKGISDLIFGGDIGTQDAVSSFFNLVRERGLNISMVLGNHDRREMVAPYVSVRGTDGTMTYSVENESSKRIILDSSVNAVGERQLQWLRTELNTEKLVLLFLHHPVIAVDTPLDRLGAALHDREQVKACLQECNKNVALFCGHYHMEDEAAEGVIRQFVTPAASYQIQRDAKDLEIDTSVFGYRLIHVDEAELHTEVVMFRR
jgi:Icc protein